MCDLLDRLEDEGAEVDETLDRLMGDEEMYIGYLKKLKDNENIHRLEEAVANKDAELASREVHTLKGVAMNLGLLSLMDVCMDMLMDFREGNPEAGFAQMPDVKECFQKWISIISED